MCNNNNNNNSNETKVESIFDNVRSKKYTYVKNICRINNNNNNNNSIQ